MTPRHFLRGRRAPPSFRVAGVAHGDIHLRFAWQAWHLQHWAGSDGALGRVLVARGAAPVCVAGVALGDIDVPFAWQAWQLGDIHLHFPWQAWHLWRWAGSGGALGRALVARGAAPLCVAGVALGDIDVPCAGDVRGRCGTW